MDIKKFHSLCIYHAQKCFDKAQFMSATVFALKSNGDVIMLTRQFDSTDEKIWMYDMYSLILMVENVVMYCFVSEAWVSRQELAEDEHIDNVNMSKFVPASEDPKRRSGVVLITTDKDKNLLSNMFMIEERKDTRRLLFDEKLPNEVRDNVKLFERIPPIDDNPNLQKMLSDFAKADKPDWFITIPKEKFNNVKVDA